MIYKYGMKHRGVGIGCQPSGFTHYEDVDKSKTGFWSFVYYNRELSEDEISKYELELLKKAGDV